MFFVFRKWTIVYVFSMLVLILGFALILQHGESVQTSSDAVLCATMPVLILDAGHGGEDGGAVSEDGTIESLINLSITVKIAELAELIGYEVQMTRDSDISIHDADAKTLREKKVSDLKNRVEFCNRFPKSILISIHQNSLPSAPRVAGAHVFYNEQQGSLELAIAVQSVLNEFINQGRHKEAKAIGSSSYLMKNVSCPAILIECGFLSNTDETHALKTDEYQRKIAVTILASVLNYLQN